MHILSEKIEWFRKAGSFSDIVLCFCYNYFVNVSIAPWFRTQIIWHLFLFWKMLQASSPGTISYMKKPTGVEAPHEDPRDDQALLKILTVTYF